MRRLTFISPFILGMLFLAVLALAQVPRTISYQGLLTDTTGVPKTDGTYSFMFRLYADSTGGTALWTETKSMSVNHGLFSTSLGDQAPLDLPFNSPYWLGVTIGADPESHPRIRLNSVGYSMRSSVADSVADGAIGGAKIAAHQVVRGLNGITDLVTIRATGGATITSTGDTITINAGSGGGSTGIQAVQNSNGTLTVANPNGPTVTINVKDQGIGTTQLANSSVTLQKLSSSGATGGQVPKFNGSAITWANDDNGGLSLPYNGTVSSSAPAVHVTNSGGGRAGQFVIDATASTDNALIGVSNGSGAGVYGEGNKNVGVWGASQNGDGVIGTSDNGYGVQGTGGAAGVNGTSSMLGVRGAASATSGGTKGVFGIASSIGGAGVFGQNTATAGVGVHGENNLGFGVTGFGNTGIYGSGQNSDNAVAILGITSGTRSISIQAIGPNYGVWGQGANIGVYAHNTGGTSAGRDAYLATQSLAADLYGNVYVHGTVTQGSGATRIDSPTDPANKYLYHSAVESADMKNIYDGVAMLDASGQATVTLPSWFEALNRDFRYQLTAIGAPGPNLYIARKVSSNTFVIAGGSAGMEVSWQITGIRQDAWSKAHPTPVEEDKPVAERGFYENPDLFGQPESKSILHAMHPETQLMAAEREKAQAALKTASSGASSANAEGGR